MEPLPAGKRSVCLQRKRKLVSGLLAGLPTCAAAVAAVAVRHRDQGQADDERERQPRQAGRGGRQQPLQPAAPLPPRWVPATQRARRCWNPDETTQVHREGRGSYVVLARRIAAKASRQGEAAAGGQVSRQGRQGRQGRLMDGTGHSAISPALFSVVGGGRRRPGRFPRSASQRSSACSRVPSRLALCIAAARSAGGAGRGD